MGIGGATVRKEHLRGHLGGGIGATKAQPWTTHGSLDYSYSAECILKENPQCSDQRTHRVQYASEPIISSLSHLVTFFQNHTDLFLVFLLFVAV